MKTVTTGTTIVSMSTDRDQLRYSNVTLKDLILNAYGVKDYQISGPDFIENSRFEIVAKLPSGAAKEQAPVMLQQLLAERFRMTLHREEKDMEAYALVLAKGGSKLQASQAGGRISMGAGHVDAQGITAANLANVLARIVGRPVSDMTGIVGAVQFKLDWEPESEAQAPSIFTAVQEQLGLKLEAQRQQVEVLVIDHVEKVPTEN